MFCEIAEKEFPLWHLPQASHLVIVKANHERSDEIEFLSEVGQGTESFDALDYAAYAEQTRDFPEHGQAIHIKPNSGVAEQLSDIKKVPRAAAEIENPLRSRQIEFELANPADVDFDPTVQIQILWPVGAGICDSVSLTNLFETSWINRFDHSFCIKLEPIRSEKPERMFSRAGQASAVDEFSYFVSKSHLTIDHSL
jgi:hypothetical protein